MVVIGTATGGLTETIGDGGQVVLPGDPDALAAAVASLIAHQQPSVLARRARTRASRFSLEVMWREYNALADDVLGATG